ncbi:hypothetical protein GCM10010178_29740 [Lentzea flava]|uniref:Uncharacterized protein n=1 Tax=Lentzea flava TaxID=103732 RepID=A0ABQ2UHQ8_9PSEU|nr:hypothetical protein [Lentzea flava]GGU35583.1 hypothetical protein GCM10010178_29740 [Lentzea flava]
MLRKIAFGAGSAMATLGITVSLPGAAAATGTSGHHSFDHDRPGSGHHAGDLGLPPIVPEVAGRSHQLHQ